MTSVAIQQSAKELISTQAISKLTPRFFAPPHLRVYQLSAVLGRFPGFILSAFSIRPAVACRRRLHRSS